MSKISYLDTRDTSIATDEPGIQKHIKFWDRKEKGYITPLDTISGFITLGYSMIFSIAIGTVVGVFLSLSTQTGWFPDPLCRSNVRNLINAKKQTQTNQGAFDANGVFVPEKFDSLFDKYAKSDKSGKSITVAELVRMTEEQERLGRDVKAWAASMIELCTAYFFIGNRGSLTREDVRSAYDGTLFYRLKDAHRLMIKQGTAANFDSTRPGLVGPYLTSSHGRLSIRGMEHQFQSLITALQSKSSAAVADYKLRDWVAYIQENTNFIKESALPNMLKRSPSSGVRGVTTPKASIYRTKAQEEDPAKLFPNGLTGVAKSYSNAVMNDSSVLNSLLQNRTDDEIAFTNETYKISNFDEGQEPTMFRNLTRDESNLLASAAKASFIADSDVPPVPKKSVSTVSNSGPLMSGFLRAREADEPKWLTGGGLTGVKGSEKDTNTSREISSSQRHEDDSDKIVKQKETSKTLNAEEEQRGTVKRQESFPPLPKPAPSKSNEENSTEIFKEATITPPPEEKITAQTTVNNKSSINTSNNKKVSANNKKVKRNKHKKTSLGQISPTSSSDSGQEQTSIKHSGSITNSS